MKNIYSIIIVVLFSLFTFISYAQDVPIPDQDTEIAIPEPPETPEVPEDETGISGTVEEKIEEIKALIEEKKLKKIPKPKGPIVAFLPFNFSYAVGPEKADIVQNEVVVAMVNSQKFSPVSLKNWADTRFKEGKGRDIHYIIDKMRVFKVPAEYICHGYIFKMKSKYALKLVMYPVKGNTNPTYYLRTFSNFYNAPQVAKQIIDEMKIRAYRDDKPLFSKKVLVKNAELNFLLYTTSKTGETHTSPQPFFKDGLVEYKKEDWYSDMFVYQFHISRIFKVFNNNIMEYTLNSQYRDTISYDYVVAPQMRISKEKKECVIKVYSGKNSSTLLFIKTYRFDRLEVDYLNEMMRKWCKDITLSLLSYDEQKRIGEVAIDSLYNDESIYLDDYYLGNGNQKDLLVPLTASKVKIWTSETPFTFKASGSKNYHYKVFNVQPYMSGISKPKNQIFNLMLGGSFLAGFYFHPQYNDKQDVIFYNSVNDETKYFELGEILDSPYITNKNIKNVYATKIEELIAKNNANNFENQISYMIGLGFDFTLESDYVMWSNQINLKGGVYQNKFVVKYEDDNNKIDINSTPITKLDITYKLYKVNFSVDYSTMPAVLLLKKDSPIRIYAGAGLFLGLWYNYYNEQIKGSGSYYSYDTDTEIDFNLDNSIKRRESLNFIIGVYPEVGVLLKFDRFALRTGVSYYFDLFKHSVVTNTEYGQLESFNRGSFVYKVGFSYFIR